MVISSHLKEAKSKRDFEALVEPWTTSWNFKDYGIDVFVGTTTRHTLKDEHYRNDNKYFAVQLKSTERIKIQGDSIVFKIETKKIIEWFRTNIPVMLVLEDLETDIFYYIWINDSLISDLDKEPNWINQSTKSLYIPKSNILSKNTLNSIRDYVNNFKNSPKKLIEPDTYFRIRELCQDKIECLDSIASRFDFQTNKISSETLHSNIENSIYRIAISGPSRAGKSSLINRLLNKNLSPVGFFQTTGVPIQIISSKKEHVSVYFLDGKIEEYPLDAKIIEQFASQDFNQDNNKKVKTVAIKAKNRQLERGISIFDIPGLDDPNDSIYDYAYQAASKANVILYLIDASSAETGGFIFRRDIKEHIDILGAEADKFFLIFNKVDVLSDSTLSELKKRIQIDLNRHQLENRVSSKIFFTSTTSKPQKNQNYDSIQSLEKDLWSFILNNNKNGLTNLSGLCREIQYSISNFEEILKSRLVDDEARGKIDSMIKDIQQKVPSLHNTLFIQKENLFNQLTIQIDNAKSSLLKNLDSELQSIPLTTSLPDENIIRDYLRTRVNNLIENCNHTHQYQLEAMKNTINEQIESNFKQLREYIYHYNQQQVVDISEIEGFNKPSFDYTSLFGTSVFAGLVSSLLNPLGGLAIGVISLIGNLIFGAEDRRINQIKKINKEVENRIDKIIPKIKSVYYSTIDQQVADIYNYAQRKINAYTLDLENQMKEFGNQVSEAEKDLYQRTFIDLKGLATDTINLKKEIDEYTGFSA
ncbi:hypothetical protein GCM10011514_07300 [Emticicia aquatilis]|uniref:DUF4365 domain-containing protein n=1 Tax=Emticicia aquatilis TaxID=1537369 RepID=A0A916YHK2_9BACT|nr:DUF4365 domain-containing protein [Emticicia aquatilis]GGD45838.1 hypothetical protein GCM10011514_07300 [Emticicia aquatilis]